MQCIIPNDTSPIKGSIKLILSDDQLNCEIEISKFVESFSQCQTGELRHLRLPNGLLLISQNLSGLVNET